MAILDFNTPGGLLNLNPSDTGSLGINLSPINEQKKIDEQKRKRAEESKKLQDFADLLRMINANQSGNAQEAAMFSNRMAQRRAEQEARQKEAQALMKKEQFERDQELFIKQNPEYAQMIRFNQLFGMDMPKPAKRDSFVAKDGYRYFVDDNTRVFPGVTVKEEQSQEDIYKENAARIKNTILTKGKNALTPNELAFYDDYMKNKGYMNIEQAMAAQMFGDSGNQNPENNKTYRIIHQAYKGTSVDALIKQSQDLNPGYTREQAINELKNNGIIAE